MVVSTLKQMKTMDDACHLSPDLLEAQARLLMLAARNGPAECFLRRTISCQVRLDGGDTVGVEHADRSEIALRVIRDNRIGICGGSAARGDRFIDRIAACAEENARFGPLVGEELFPNMPSHGRCHIPQMPEPTDLVTLGSEFLSGLQAQRPSFHWSGEVSLKSRESRVVHSGGLEGWSTMMEYRLQIRARRLSHGGLVDRLLDVRGSSWDGVTTQITARIEAEFPESEDIRAAPSTAQIALGAPVVAVLCQGVAFGHLREPVSLSGHVTIWDEPTVNFEGCDDVGVPVSPITLVDRGRVLQWQGAGTTAARPGRAFRKAIDAPPACSLLGLHWTTSADFAPPLSVLYTEFAGVSIRPNGQIQGTATEGIVLQDGKPTYRCPGRVMRISIKESLGKRLIGVSQQQYASGRHRLPVIVLAQ